MFQKEKATMTLNDLLNSDPETMSGAVVFKGTRVPADTLFQYLAGGSSVDEFLDDFPTVERDQVEALLRILAADAEQKILDRAA
jgi:uncharacterized protein (DUF433 family)